MIKVENPGTKQVETLLENVHDESYVTPYFQLGFKWQPSMISERFESILRKGVNADSRLPVQYDYLID